jgi:hypothetical protein
MKDWQAAMDEIQKRECWGIKFRHREGNPNRSHSVRVGGVRIGCSEIHKSELAKEIKLKRSSRAECEWNMKDWQAAMDEIHKSRCWGIQFHMHMRKGMGNPKRVYPDTRHVLRACGWSAHRVFYDPQIGVGQGNQTQAEQPG